MLVLQSRLAAALKTLAPAISKKVHLPILQYVRLEASSHALNLQATDMELAFSLTIPAEEGETWVSTVPFKALQACVKAIPKGATLSLERGGPDHLRVSHMGQTATLPAVDPEPFPALPERPRGAKQLTVTLDKRTLIARSKNATKPTLSAMCLALDRGELVCCDGFRLALTPIGASVPKGPRLVVPAHAPLFDGPKTIVWDDRHLYWHEPGLEASIRLESGNYPAYEKVVCSGLGRHVTVNRQAMKDALAFVGTKSDDYNKTVNLYFEHPNLRLTLVHPGDGEASTSIGFHGESQPFTLAFNLHYLKDMVKVSSGEEVTYRFKDEIGPGTWDGWYTLMPVQIARV